MAKPWGTHRWCWGERKKEFPKKTTTYEDERKVRRSKTIEERGEKSQKKKKVLKVKGWERQTKNLPLRPLNQLKILYGSEKETEGKT